MDDDVVVIMLLWMIMLRRDTRAARILLVVVVVLVVVIMVKEKVFHKREGERGVPLRPAEIFFFPLVFFVVLCIVDPEKCASFTRVMLSKV